MLLEYRSANGVLRCTLQDQGLRDQHVAECEIMSKDKEEEEREEQDMMGDGEEGRREGDGERTAWK